MLNVCITGTIGSGKTSILELLGQMLHCATVQADTVGRDLMQVGAPGHTLFRQRFSDQYLREDGSLDRGLLKNAIAESPSLKNELEKLLHPLIRRKMMEIQPSESYSRQVMVYEVPLLFEAGWQNDFDIVVAVYVHYDLGRQRLIKRDGISLQYAEKLLDLQMSSWQKAMHADMVIDNSHSLAYTNFQLLYLVSTIRALTERKTGKSAEKS